MQVESRITEQGSLQSLQGSLQTFAIRHVPLPPKGLSKLPADHAKTMIDQWSCTEELAPTEILSLTGQLARQLTSGQGLKQASGSVKGRMQTAETAPALAMRWHSRDCQPSHAGSGDRAQARLEIGTVALTWNPRLIGQLKGFHQQRLDTQSSHEVPSGQDIQTELPIVHNAVNVPHSAASSPLKHTALDRLSKALAGCDLSTSVHKLQLQVPAAQAAADITGMVPLALILCMLNIQLTSCSADSAQQLAASSLHHIPSHLCSSRLSISANLLAGTTAVSALHQGPGQIHSNHLMAFGPECNLQLGICLPCNELGNSWDIRQSEQAGPQLNMLANDELLVAFAPELKVAELSWHFGSTQLRVLEAILATVGVLGSSSKSQLPATSVQAEPPQQQGAAQHERRGAFSLLQGLEIVIKPATVNLASTAAGTVISGFCAVLHALALKVMHTS